LFTDVEHSTRLWERYPAAMRVMLARHDALLHRAARAHGGHIFKTVGDAFYVAFPDAGAAVRAAVAASGRSRPKIGPGAARRRRGLRANQGAHGCP
jgi:class 3 adenylate cyclase